ncbi:MAG TPA: hypothetical protein VMH36_18815 [Alphaproteobacteria bacterium]|nr:hypothetical protein [Alphaproteobacteria bacterium]
MTLTLLFRAGVALCVLALAAPAYAGSADGVATRVAPSLTVKGPAKVASRLAADRPYRPWFLCARQGFGQTFRMPISTIENQNARTSTLFIQFPNGQLIVTVEARSAARAEATVFTTLDNPDNPARVETAMAELGKCSSL